jgi:hypothetical protein
MHWKLFNSRPRKIVHAKWKGIEIENEHFRVQLIPSMGRVHSFVHKATGNEQLWINPCALPLGANNDTGFWMTWGGIERVLPRREHGTTHALGWKYAVEEDNTDRKTVHCEVTEPITGIHHELVFAVYDELPYLETTIVLTNRSDAAQSFSHWTTTVLAPGGKGEVTPKTELILPADRFRPDDRDFNDWMLKLEMASDMSPLRFVENWKSIGDLMTSPLKRPYYAVYSHEADEGIVHTFDLKATPTVDIWGWGYHPTEDRQKEFTVDLPNKGYIEFWNGNASSFKEEGLKQLERGAEMRWVERTFAVNNLLKRGVDLRRELDRQVKSYEK